MRGRTLAILLAALLLALAAPLARAADAASALDVYLFWALGCPHCERRGYNGRVGIYELLEMDGALADALRTGDAQVFTAAVHASTHYRPLAHAAESGTGGRRR